MSASASCESAAALRIALIWNASLWRAVIALFPCPLIRRKGRPVDDYASTDYKWHFHAHLGGTCSSPSQQFLCTLDEMIGPLLPTSWYPDAYTGLHLWTMEKLEESWQALLLPQPEADPQRMDDHRDPARGLSAADLAATLGVSEETVRAREHAGELFSVVRPARGCGREYPEFQAWKEIAGEPLKQVLQALDHPNGPAAYAFFTSPQETLAGLAPVDVLASRQAHSREHDEVLSKSNEDRLAMVIAAARSFAATLAC